MKKYIVLVLFLALGISCKEKTKKEAINVKETSRVESLPYYNEKSFTPHWITPNTPEEKAFHKIPDFKLVNQLGDTLTQQNFDTKIYITDFFFTSCPGICPQMTNSMVGLQEKFKDDDSVLFLSHSVTPTIDTVKELKIYADRFGVIANKWHLVTGDKTEIYNLGRNEYYVENDLGIPKDINDFLHSENFLLIDKNKHIRGIYNGLNRASMAQLVVDIKSLEKEG
ncbi:SCO family protein [Cellulophaga sp. E16_2]|uniref:Electron transport protein SCO1/SenC n=1 Tax=Cellulophaga algicola (strain DSM 14237 / IC166 / ACAM 630) TaxID=688270 RepID=E6XEL0_CELAD|nr:MULTISPECIES: SCO family protein [Cellulophaga]ADV51338.1 electron transport protein SCO1/SenC [Cellulophaga algicola DSM 14237]MBO0593713.1 SCO family protein [Cellulophaga sp. E16_2]